MTILEERGVFWWNDEPIPPQHLAPNSSVTGLLRIEDDGRITLELDGFLPNDAGPLAAVMSRDVETLDRLIQGVLKGSGKRALLVGIIPNGGSFRSNAMSYQQFVAVECLIGESTFPADKKTPAFKDLHIGLEGFEDWLRLGSIEVKRSKARISAKYKKLKNAVYVSDDGRLSINFNIEGSVPVGLRTSKLSIKESASLTFRPKNASSLENLKETYANLEDLFILLTDSDYCLEWPFLSVDGKSKYRWYFLRARSRDAGSPPGGHECWTNFVQLRDVFGKIWSNWKSKRQHFGPGFYLYLGTRRGIKLYAEHQFVNLIWGIESFHRTRFSASGTGALAAKIQRIVAQVRDRKDQKWLEGRLRHANEPPLEQRLFDAFRALPLNLDQKRLRAFSKSCADRRNEISHFGGPRPGTTYTDFVKDLAKKSQALSTLYHTLLLHEIGVDEKILKWWIYEGFQSYPIKANFVEVGLLDNAVLKPS